MPRPFFSALLGLVVANCAYGGEPEALTGALTFDSAAALALRLPASTRSFIAVAPSKVWYSPPTRILTHGYGKKRTNSPPLIDSPPSDLLRLCVLECATHRVNEGCRPLHLKCKEEALGGRVPFVVWTSAEYGESKNRKIAVGCIMAFLEPIPSDELQLLCGPSSRLESQIDGQAIYVCKNKSGDERLFVTTIGGALVACSTHVDHLRELADHLGRDTSPGDAAFPSQSPAWSQVDCSSRLWGICRAGRFQEDRNALSDGAVVFFLDRKSDNGLVIRHSTRDVLDERMRVEAGRPWQEMYELDVDPADLDSRVIETRVQLLGMLDSRTLAERNVVRMSPLNMGLWLLESAEATWSMQKTRPAPQQPK